MISKGNQVGGREIFFVYFSLRWTVYDMERESGGGGGIHFLDFLTF